MRPYPVARPFERGEDRVPEGVVAGPREVDAVLVPEAVPVAAAAGPARERVEVHAVAARQLRVDGNPRLRGPGPPVARELRQRHGERARTRAGARHGRAELRDVVQDGRGRVAAEVVRAR